MTSYIFKMLAYFVFSLRFFYYLEQTVLLIHGIAILFHSKASGKERQPSNILAVVIWGQFLESPETVRAHFG